MAGGSFIVQPVHRVSVRTPLHPVVVRADSVNDKGYPVNARCYLQNSSRQVIGQLHDPQTSTVVDAMYSTDPQMPELMCAASDAIYSDEVLKSRKQREKEAARGAASSSSSADAYGGTHVYFAFNQLHVYFPGTYYIGVEIYSVDHQGNLYVTGRVRSEAIEVSEMPATGLGFAEQPNSKERKYLKRLSHLEAAAQCNIPQNYD